MVYFLSRFFGGAFGKFGELTSLCAGRVVVGVVIVVVVVVGVGVVVVVSLVVGVVVRVVVVVVVSDRHSVGRSP